MTVERKTPSESPKKAPKASQELPEEVRRLEFPVGTHQFSDETGEYAVDPSTGKVIRKL